MSARPRAPSESATVDKIMGMKKSAVEAADNENYKLLLDVIENLKGIRMTESVLKGNTNLKRARRKTDIGLFISSLRKSPNAQVASLAKEIIRSWKQDVKAQTGGSPGAKTKKPNATPPNLQIPRRQSSFSASGGGKMDSGHELTTSEQEKSGELGSSEPRKQSLPCQSPSGTPIVDSDNATFRELGETIRNKAVRMMYKALSTESTAGNETLTNRAHEVEEAVYQLYGTTQGDYPNKFRSLYLNLTSKDNHALRSAIVNGEVTASKFVTMSPEDMVSEERKQKDRQLQEENLFKARGAGNMEAETDQFKCGKCGQRRTTYYQLQTRSADEPMTTFVTCVNCNNRWKF